MDDLDDSSVIENILAGDIDSFEIILERYQNQIFAYVFRMLNFHREDAKDASAETFCRAYLKLASFDKRQKFSSWLYRIAHNLVIDEYSRRSKYKTVDIENLEIPAKIDEKIWDREILDKILNKLSFEDREILILFYIEEKSIKEIVPTQPNLLPY